MRFFVYWLRAMLAGIGVLLCVGLAVGVVYVFGHSLGPWWGAGAAAFIVVSLMSGAIASMDVEFEKHEKRREP